jgi:putative hydrolase of the HAD superfamily
VGQVRGQTIDAGEVNRRFAEAWSARVNFDYSKESWRGLVGCALGVMTGAPLDEALFGRIYDRFREPDTWRCGEGVVEALAALASRGMPMAVISNWDERLRPLLGRMGLSHYFRVMTISAEAGFTKPDARMFRQTARALGVAPRELLHVGDNLREDVAGARAAGCQAVLLSRDTQVKRPEPELTSMKDFILALVKSKQGCGSIRNNFDSQNASG